MTGREPPSSRPRRGTLLRWALATAVVALLVLFARRLDWRATAASLRHASLPLLVVATLANLASIAVKGVRWWVFLRPVGARGIAVPIRASVAGAGLNNVLVANGGDAARVVFVTRATGVPGATVLATMAVERAWDAIGYVVLLCASVVLFPLPEALRRWRYAAFAALALTVAGLALLVRARPASERAEPAAVGRTGDQVATGRVRRYVAGFADSVRSVSSVGRFAAALALSMITWALQVVTYGATAAAAHAPLPVAGDISTVLAVNLGFAFRVTPGGVGVFQALYALGAGHFGMPQATAVAVAVLIQSIQIIPVTILGVALAPEFIFGRRAVASS